MVVLQHGFYRLGNNIFHGSAPSGVNNGNGRIFLIIQKPLSAIMMKMYRLRKLWNYLAKIWPIKCVK